jgi:hypothetical protein
MEKSIMTEKTKMPPTEMFEQAMKNYEQALKTGLKMQEESGKWWTNVLNQATSMPDWQKQVGTLTKEVLPATQKRMSECLQLIEQNSRASVELLKKAVEAVTVPPGTEAQSKLVDFWESSLHALRDNAKAISEVNTRTLDAWIDFIRKNTGTVEPKAKA